MGSVQLEEEYTRFSALIHFLDPSKDEEERSLNLDLKPYANVLRVLEDTSELTADSLTGLLSTSPEAIEILELLLQNSNFTTAQRAFLMFDLQRLNSSSIDEVLRYIGEVLREDKMVSQFFRKKGLLDSMIDLNTAKLNDERKRYLLAQSKKIVAEICDRRDSALLRNRIRVSETTRRRAADYLVYRRALPKVLAGIHPRIFLENKRVPVDSKTAHGKYASEILENILVDGGFQCRKDFGPQISRTGSLQQLSDDSSQIFFYCKEREVESSSPGVSISSESATTNRTTAKKFDFVLLHGSTPKVVIETNFYTTSGSKIGINEKEYITLHTHMAQAEKGLRFIWVTDGGYWLTSGGKSSFFKLSSSFGEDLMNLALFAMSLQSISHTMTAEY